jgi:glycosyltransferase involved in cell wall biosynthesis
LKQCVGQKHGHWDQRAANRNASKLIKLKARSGTEVLHIVPALFRGEGGIVGGAERYAFERARHMSERCATSLITFGDKEEEFYSGKLRIRVLGGSVYVKGQRTNPIARGLFREIWRARFVHCHQQHVVASTITALSGRMMGRRVFVSDLGGGGWDLSSYVSTDRLYHGHLHISEYSRTIYGHAGKSWAEVIYGGVDTAKFSPDSLMKRKHKVVFVGRLMPHKGVDDLIHAIPPGIQLDLVGQPYHERFLTELKQISHGKDVRFRHDCTDEELVNAYRESLCVVLPSVYQDRYGSRTKVPELLGQTLLEGMACGTPAICTDVASMPEVVLDGKTGFVVPPNEPQSLRDRLCWLRDHPEAVELMGATGRERVLQHFRWPQVVSRCLEIYRRGMANNCCRPA